MRNSNIYLEVIGHKKCRIQIDIYIFTSTKDLYIKLVKKSI